MGGEDRPRLPQISGRGSVAPGKGVVTAPVATVTMEGEAAAARPAPSPSDSADADPFGCGETLTGIVVFGVLALIVYLVYSIFSIGSPASYLTVGALACAGIAYIAAETIKDIDAKRKRVTTTIAAGLVADAMRAALWTAAGLGAVWLFLLLLHFAPGFVGPALAADIQIGAYDLADGLKRLVTPWRFAGAIAAAVAISVVAGTVWPINAAGTAKKWIGTIALLLFTFANVTFVSVRAGSTRYAEAVAPIQAKIGEDIGRLRAARQEHATLQWFGAELEQQIENSPPDAEAWRQYLSLAADQCRAAEQKFETGYKTYFTFMTSRDPTYCQTDDYVPRLVERQFRTGGGSGAGPASESLWVPEFSALADGRYPERMRALKAVAGQVDKAAADEERARDRIEATVVALVSSMVGDAGGGVADQVLARMKETVLKAVVRDGRERVSMWLRLNAAARPRAVDAILGIEPELKLESPRLAMAAAGGAEAFVARTWNEEHHPTVSLEKLGRDAAIQHQKDVEQQQRDAETARIAAAEARERAEVARRARGPRIR